MSSSVTLGQKLAVRLAAYNASQFTRIVDSLFASLQSKGVPLTIEGVRSTIGSKAVLSLFSAPVFDALVEYILTNGTSNDERGVYPDILCTPDKADIGNLVDLIGFTALTDFLYGCSTSSSFPEFTATKAQAASIMSKLSVSQQIDALGVREDGSTPNSLIDVLSSKADYTGACREISKKVPWIAADLLRYFSPKAFKVLCIRVLWDIIFAYDFAKKFIAMNTLIDPSFEATYLELCMEAYLSGANGTWPGPTAKINVSSKVLFVQQLMFAPYRICLSNVDVATMLCLTPGNAHNIVAIYPLQESIGPDMCSAVRDFAGFALTAGPGFVEQFKQLTGSITGGSADE